MLALILGVGFYLTKRTAAAQLRLFPEAFHSFLERLFGKDDPQGSSSFRALCTALAATVGTGNIAGVAGAIAIGGPGAVFWMWISAFFGMMTKFAETTLAVRYRTQTEDGEYVGGPMYMISKGLGNSYDGLAKLYSIFGVIAAFGVGNATQINAVVTGFNGALEALGGQETVWGNIVLGFILAVLVAAMLLGGARRIGEVAELLVPFAAVLYMVLSIGVLWIHVDALDDALLAILQGAFSPRAVTGGAIGSAFVAIRMGVSRGVFSNEAGMGTAAIAHAAAQVEHPVQQGLMGIMEVFLDTIVICTLTALVILTSDIPIPYGTDAGAFLTIQAFVSVYGDWVSFVMAVCLCCFAFATVLGWGLYGARCAQYLWGNRSWKIFAFLQTIIVLFSAIMKTETVWILSEIVNALMAIPNLLALALLTPELERLLIDYQKTIGHKKVNGGTYENFNQCESMRTISYAEIPSAGDGLRKKR